MKRYRYNKIKEIVQSKAIETQEELAAALLQERSRINRLFQDSLIKVDHSLNQVVLHTIPGSAQSVAFSIDHAKWSELIGTLAGDDTILLIARSEAEVPAILSRIQDLMKD